MPPKTPSEQSDPAFVHANETGPALLLSRFFVVLAAAALLSSISLTIRSYMPCPFWDEWAFVNAIAAGAGPSSWKWLWSQHNEHRLLITRLLILLDLRAFGGKNLSLFFEMYLAQLSAWGGICFVLERFTRFPRSLKSTLEGICGFCLFHFNQGENFTWAFQASFVLAFSVGILALLAVAFFERLHKPLIIAILIGLAPLLAALNVSGGLLIGPVAFAFALWRRLPARYALLIGVLSLASAAAYLTGYHVPPSHLTPVAAIAHPKDVFVYVLTYFGASWTRLVPHKERITCFLSLLALVVLIVMAIRHRDLTRPFESFCVAQCLLMVAVAAVTALGRLQYGVGQAYAGRYQTPAMIYWACLGSLLLIAIWRFKPRYFLAAQGLTLLIMAASAATFLPIWQSTVASNDRISQACTTVMSGSRSESAAKLLYGGSRQDVAPGVAYLHRLWNR